MTQTSISCRAQRSLLYWVSKPRGERYFQSSFLGKHVCYCNSSTSLSRSLKFNYLEGVVFILAISYCAIRRFIIKYTKNALGIFRKIQMLLRFC
ncbi:hypothetical protein BCR42DRAFT_406218 [Absidia repens]|uniref:Uncharacterized protein n=1 Tax=Absidia repens TaxID=90262 RepID=A0A1X2IUI0_9FUNG|nr:hypothetical protein BCR42DRAFT_406218 [Absidia repens]